MSSVSNDVDVIITTESGVVAVKGFGLPTVVADSALLSSDGGFVRWKKYGDLTEVSADFANTTWAYKWASAIFSAETPPSEIAIALTATDDTNFTDSLTKVLTASEGFFAFSIESRTYQDAEDTAIWVEANKLFFAYTEDTDEDIGGSVDPTGLGKYVFDNGLSHTAVYYHEDAETLPTEGNFIGTFIALTIGKWTAKFKDAIGLSVSLLDTAQVSASRALNVNTFVDKGNFRSVQEGTTGATFIDEIFGDAWVKARMTEAILSLQKKYDIIPYDDDGISLGDTALAGVLNQAIENGIVTDHAFDVDGNRTGGYEITSPKASTIDSTVKETRVYSETTFTYFKRVAMHKNVINGVAQY